MEAMAPGGHLRIKTRADDDSVFLLFGDTGSGIKQDDLDEAVSTIPHDQAGRHGAWPDDRPADHAASTAGRSGWKARRTGTLITLQFPRKDRRVRMLKNGGKRISMLSSAAALLAGAWLAGCAQIPVTREPANLSDAKAAVVRYHDEGGYERELAEVAAQARTGSSSVCRPGRPVSALAVVFDIDETVLSNYGHMRTEDFCYSRGVGGLGSRRPKLRRSSRCARCF